MEQKTVLHMKQITKRFPGVLALDNVDFEVKEGEIHALIGENGAGKSTLIKTLGGVHPPDSGTIEISGQPVQIMHPQDAFEHGIGIIYQEFNLVQTLNVAENIFLGDEITNAFGHMNRAEMHRRSREAMAQLGIRDFDTATKIRDLSVAMQQLVEISKALFHNSRILVMDEPTAVLTDRESEKLFSLMLQLKERGISIIYISHRLKEVVSISDRITVLRDGRYIATLDNGSHDIDQNILIRNMVGRELHNYYPQKSTLPRPDHVVLEARGLTRARMFKDISFAVRQGEILGVSGLVGAGRTEIMKALFGVISLDSGEILIDGKPARIDSPAAARRAGLALVPEDRKREGVNLAMSIADNIAMASHKELSVYGHIVPAWENRLVDRYVDEMHIRPGDSKRLVRNLSGGNQQKVVVAKWMATAPKVIIFDEPTRGIDIGAKAEIYELINNMTDAGMAVVVVSSELQELLGICDRIIVISFGRKSGEFSRDEFDPDLIMKASTVVMD